MRNKPGWDNATLERYLEAMQKTLAGPISNDEPKWRTIAKLLLAASSRDQMSNQPTIVRRLLADPGFGVYIHWPFCAQKCPYCDFNSHVRHGGWDEARFLAAYKRELEHRGGADQASHRLLHILRRRHAVADEARNRRRHPRPHRQAVDRRRERRDHARSQSRQRRGRALSRLSRSRRQSRVDGRAIAARRGTEKARPHPHRRRGQGSARHRAHDLRALFLRPHLRAPRTDA